VRYTDGGYKRFGAEEFQELVAEDFQGPASVMSEFGPTAHRRIAAETSELEALHVKIMDAVRRPRALEISASGKSRRRANKCFWSRRFVFYAIWVIMHQYFTRFGS